MKIGLKQIDGKWANLALMKLSAWHKAQSDHVEWYQPLFEPYDKVYASKTFTDTPDDGYLPRGTVKGGSGYNLEARLTDEIEQTFPDYSIYPSVDYAIGFTTRGCPRKCPFCIVPQKEGNLKVVGNLYSFWDEQKKVVLLDNNLTAAPMRHFEMLMEQFRKTRVSVDFSQGLDLRLLRNEHCIALKGVKRNKQIHFAWDRMKDEERIMRGLSIFSSHFHPSNAMVYILIGFDTTPEEDLYRVEILRKMGVDPYVMPYGKGSEYKTAMVGLINCPSRFQQTAKTDSNYLQRFARWVNHKAIFKSVSWEKYRG